MPANREATTSISRIAGFDAAAAKYKFVTIDANGEAQLATSGARAEGVVNAEGPENHAIGIDIAGRTLVRLGASVTAGDAVQSDANGLAVTQASTGIVCGTALETGVVDDVISIVFDPQGAP